MKKERLYISDLLDEPVVPYPAWYLLSPKLHSDPELREALTAIHSADFGNYENPGGYREIFGSVAGGRYAIYHDTYLVAEFGGRLMYLDRSGWRSMSVTEGIFDMNGWLVRGS